MQTLTKKLISIAINNKTTDTNKIIEVLTDRRKVTRMEYVLNRLMDRRR
ncbi:MAG: hypothetical protein PHW73_01860 [Atribacterota bacterium]|nr:hypothetical protein [Atribacterota bacterium]